MEYGEAVTGEAFDQAIAIARSLLKGEPQALDAVAGNAVARAYCVCVIDGEDAAEGRLSDVHRALVEAVADQLRSESGANQKEKVAWP